MSEQTSYLDICIDENNVAELNQEVLNYSPSSTTSSSLSDYQSKAMSDLKTEETQGANEDRNMTNLKIEHAQESKRDDMASNNEVCILYFICRYFNFNIRHYLEILYLLEEF
jgi:hypothetical protein